MDDVNAVTVESGVNPQGGAWVRMLTDKALAKLGREFLDDEQAGKMLILAMRDAREDNLKIPEAQS